MCPPLGLPVLVSQFPFLESLAGYRGREEPRYMYLPYNDKGCVALRIGVGSIT